MRNLIVRLFIFVIFSSFSLSCATKRLTTGNYQAENALPGTLCDSVFNFKTLYISRIDANIEIGEENYDAKLMLYYIPDSILFLSVVSTGFEIVRVGVVPDSTIYINRIDKMVYIYRHSDTGFESPIRFYDIELLLNKSKQCSFSKKMVDRNLNILIDNSVQDIKKQLIISGVSLKLDKFEFFQKKTAEYIVGERTNDMEFTIYSNFFVDDVVLRTSGGVIEYDKKIDIDLSFNRNKYDTIYY